MKVSPILLAGKTLWVLALLLVAVPAVGLQIDRQARKDSALAGKVPGIFQAYALEPLASQAYASNDDERGLGYSRELVLRRPVPAEGLSLLTRGLILANDENMAVEALVLSAQRGWRPTFTQLMIANSALAAGDSQTAAQRVLALWRLRRPNPEVKQLTEVLLASDAGQDAFTNGLVTRDDWLDDFVPWAVAQRVPGRGLAVVAAVLADKKVKLDCPRLANSARALALSGRAEEAQNIWSRLCAQAVSGAATPYGKDYSFSGEVGVPSVFGWNYPGDGRLSVEVVEGKYGNALKYENSEHVLATLAQRVALLRPGSHSVSIEANSDGSLTADPIVLQIRCHGEDGAVQKPARLWVRNEPVAFSIPQAGCVGQEIALLAGNGEGLIQRVSFD